MQLLLESGPSHFTTGEFSTPRARALEHIKVGEREEGNLQAAAVLAYREAGTYIQFPLEWQCRPPLHPPAPSMMPREVSKSQ